MSLTAASGGHTLTLPPTSCKAGTGAVRGMRSSKGWGEECNASVAHLQLPAARCCLLTARCRAVTDPNTGAQPAFGTPAYLDVTDTNGHGTHCGALPLRLPPLQAPGMCLLQCQHHRALTYRPWHLPPPLLPCRLSQRAALPPLATTARACREPRGTRPSTSAKVGPSPAKLLDTPAQRCLCASLRPSLASALLLVPPLRPVVQRSAPTASFTVLPLWTATTCVPA